MFAKIIEGVRNRLSRGDPKAAFAERYAAYQDACRREDTRAQHDSWPALHQAMNARLKARA